MEDILTHQYLTFRVSTELFSLNVSGVQEVLDLPKITRVPRVPSYIRGVINLRGSVVPVIDLSVKLGMDQIIDGEDTSVVVAEVELEEETVVMGLLCDAVDEVIELYPHEIEPPPRIGTTVDNTYIDGMGKLGEEFVIILNITKVMDDEEIGVVSTAKS